MHVEALWRYPVKSLGCEPLGQAVFTSDGVEGDRLVHVRGPRGVLTGRTRYGPITIPATTGPDGPLVDGHPWDSRQAHERVLPFGGRLTRYDGPERFDVLNGSFRAVTPHESSPRASKQERELMVRIRGAGH